MTETEPNLEAEKSALFLNSFWERTGIDSCCRICGSRAAEALPLKLASNIASTGTVGSFSYELVALTMKVCAGCGNVLLFSEKAMSRILASLAQRPADNPPSESRASRVRQEG